MVCLQVVLIPQGTLRRESTLFGGALIGSLGGRFRLVRCLCVHIFLRVDGKVSTQFQHWEPSNPFAGNRSDEQCNARMLCA